MITIHQGTLDTLDSVANMWIDMVQEKRPDWNPDVTAWKAMAKAMMGTGSYVQLIATEGNKMVGFGDFVFFPEPSTGKLHSVGQHFFVSPDYRKGSAGYKLYKTWKDISKDFGATVMELFSFTDETARWTKVGFNPVRTLLRKEI